MDVNRAIWPSILIGSAFVTLIEICGLHLADIIWKTFEMMFAFFLLYALIRVFLSIWIFGRPFLATLRSYFTAKYQYNVIFDWKDPCIVGQTQSFRILLPGKRSTLTVAEKKKILENITIEIKEGSSNSKIHFLKEIVNTPQDDNSCLIVKFSVRVSGKYSIQAVSGSYHIHGSPFTKIFLPGDLNVEKTELLRPSPIVLFTTFEDRILHIKPKDKFENPCQVTQAELERLNFTANWADGLDGNGRTDATCHHKFQKVFPSSQGIILRPNFQRPGFFHGSVAYNEKEIFHGKFDIVAITNGERAVLDHILANRPSWTYHQAKLLVLGNEAQRGQKIYIYVSPNQLYIRDYFWGLIPRRIATFRVSSLTKIEFLFANNDADTYTISIFDAVQPKVVVEMETTVARMVIAMFSHFLQRRLGGSESFSAKQSFFYQELKALRKELRIPLTIIKICRQDIIGTTLSQTRYYSGKGWCKNFKIEFQGELGMDAGGPKREWLDLLCIKLFHNNAEGLFTSFSNSRLVHPNPTSRRSSAWAIKHFELAGKIVGKCLFETAHGLSYKQMVNGRFTRSFYAQVLGLRPNFKHFEQDDPELYLGKIKFMLENDVDLMELTFTEEEYTVTGKLLKVVDLIPGGSKIVVTNENKEEYLNALANYRLALKVTKEIEAFLRGLHEIVPDELLNNFDENELELLWCGRSEFKIEDLRKNFVKGGWDWDPVYNRLLKWFFSVVSSLSEDEKARLMQFTTGSSLLPHGGFKELNPQFKISMSNGFGKLPTAHTCFNEICLSDSDSFENFERCFKIAINEGSEGFAFR